MGSVRPQAHAVDSTHSVRSYLFNDFENRFGFGKIKAPINQVKNHLWLLENFSVQKKISPVRNAGCLYVGGGVHKPLLAMLVEQAR